MARTCYLLASLSLAACTGSPATLALPPAFEVMTPAGLASVSIRQSPPGMTDAEFTRLVSAGMQLAAFRKMRAGPAESPHPMQRIVWHVNPFSPKPMSQLVVNVFDGADPYAYEEVSLANDASQAAITSDVASMSARLLRDVAAQHERPHGPLIVRSKGPQQSPA